MKALFDEKFQIDQEIYIRQLCKDAITNDYIRWLNDYEAMKYTEQRYFSHELEEVVEFVNRVNESDDETLFGIFFADIHIGNIKLGPINFRHKSAELSYVIGNRDFWGKGIATKCVKAVMGLGVEFFNIEKYTAGYYECNPASGAVLTKAGFVVEGVRRKQSIFEGDRIDTILMGYVVSE